MKNSREKAGNRETYETLTYWGIGVLIVAVGAMFVSVFLVFGSRLAVPGFEHEMLLDFLCSFGALRAIYGVLVNGVRADLDWTWRPYYVALFAALGLGIEAMVLSDVRLPGAFEGLLGTLDVGVSAVIVLHWLLMSAPVVEGITGTVVPRIPEFLLFMCMPTKVRLPVAGDLYEDYMVRVLPRFGRTWANAWYCWWVLWNIISYYCSLIVPKWESIVWPILKWVGIPAAGLRLLSSTGAIDKISDFIFRHFLR